jgi:ABC-2 type transport system permease protein
MVPLQAVLFPTGLLVIYGLLVGKSMVRLTGNSGLDQLIPVCLLAGAMAGAIGAGLSVPYDRDSGLLTRLWMMPVHRTSPLTGALLAEAVRTFVASALVVAIGYAMGFRFAGGWIGLLVYLLIPVIVVVVFATIVITLALRPQGRIILMWTNTACTGLAFATLIPSAKVPALLRPLADYQPVAPAAAAMRALSSGGDAWLPILLTVLWAVVLGALFVPAAVRGYRAAVEGGKVDG